MWLFFLTSFSIGVEAGLNQPALGFEDLRVGNSACLLITKEYKFFDLSLGLENSFYRGENLGYSLNFFGPMVSLSKRGWRYSPVIEFGGKYIYRSYRSSREIGGSLNYALGFRINFKFEKLMLYPKFYYEGVTDFRKSGGFLGVKLGIGYEI